MNRLPALPWCLDLSEEPNEMNLFFEVERRLEKIGLFYLSTTDGIVEFYDVPMSP